MRKHQKLAVLKDDEVDRLERASTATTGLPDTYCVRLQKLWHWMRYSLQVTHLLEARHMISPVWLKETQVILAAWRIAI